jgi:hypothetical protein
LDRFDYFASECRKRGIYYGWSWVFGHSIRPEDKKRLIAYDELMAAGGGTTRVPVFIGEDIQDLRIEMLMTLLKHKNPYTGLTYANDPALAFIEFHNEDSIFFYTFAGFNNLDKLPTYKKLFNQRFSRWLKAKYGSHAGLLKAWGEKALNAYDVKNEDLSKENILVQGNPWFASPDGLKQGKELGTERRILDTAAFLHHVQGEFYRKFRKAIVQAGYKGPLVGSCWATPEGVPQYYNLHNDYEVGFIDRHTYFGGYGGWKPRKDKFNAKAQVDNPGSGMLSIGLLQVKDRPFAVSEWATVFPNEWLVESPAIYAAYGMGLQGWDASYQFASHTYKGKNFASRVSDPLLWVFDQPANIGIYPALARMIYRKDVKEAPIISTRRVSMEELLDGKPDWMNEEKIKQSWDFKEYGGTVSSAALAIGRVVVDFTEKPEPSEFPDMKKYIKDDVIHSVTGQLKWSGTGEGKRGYFTIDTEGTKALVGFMTGKAMKLGQVTFRSDNLFAGLFLTAVEKDKTLKDSKTLLLAAMARTRNTGQKFNNDENELLEIGKAPILIEPVKAEITIAERLIKKVSILDHDGRETNQTLPVLNGTFKIDGTLDKAFYYAVELQ